MSKQAADELRGLEMTVRAAMDNWLVALENDDDKRHEIWDAAHAAAETLNARKDELDPAP